MKPKCAICGKEGRVVKLPHGTINICYDDRCLKRFIILITDAVPILWYAPADLSEHESAHEDVIKYATKPEYILDNGARMAELIWDDIRETFHEAFHEALSYIGRDLEKQFIQETDLKKLIPYIGEFKHDEANEELEKRLKGE